jgi:hypothetical protein
VDRLADDRAGLGERAHQHKRRELAEVIAGAGHRLAEALVRRALPWVVAGVGQRDGAVDNLPAVEPFAERLVHGVLDRTEERARHRPVHGDLARIADTAARRRGLDAQPDGREERVLAFADPLNGGTCPDRPLDADRRGLAELDLEAEVGEERRLDHLLLHLPVDGDVELMPSLVLA